MILSHKYKFIFVKNEKVAGTSLEIGLSKFCGDKDIITPIGQEYLRKNNNIRGQQNNNGFFNHMNVSKIKLKINKDIWNNYYKFSFVRNPWDLAVSLYFFKMKRFNQKYKSFKQFIKNINNFNENIQRITINNNIVVDNVFKYENLNESLKIIENKLNLPKPIKLGNAKTQYRNENKHYSLYYDDEDIEFVRKRANNTIKKFNYEFEDKR